MPIVQYDPTIYKGLWLQNEPYVTGNIVFHNNSLWVANSDFVSSAIFDELNWTCSTALF